MTTATRKRKRDEPPLERYLDRQVRKILRAYRLLGPIDRQNPGGRYYTLKDGRQRYLRHGRKGMLDYGGWLPRDGRHIEFELKRKGERPSPEQWARIRQINADGGIAFWFNSADDFARVLRHVLAGARIVFDADRTQYVVADGSSRAETRAVVEDCEP